MIKLTIGNSIIVKLNVFFLLFLSLLATKADETKDLMVKKDSSELAKLHELTKSYVTNSDSLIKYSKLGIEQSKLLGDVDYEARFLNYLTIAYQNQGKFNQALETGKLSKQKFDQADNILWAAGISHQIGTIYQELFRYDSAMIFYKQALSYHDQLEVNPGTMEALYAIANINELNHHIDHAEFWGRRMKELAQENGFDHYVSLANFLLGRVYDQKGIYDSAIILKKEALSSVSLVKPNSYVAIIESLGSSFLSDEQTDSAFRYFQRYYDLSRNDEYNIYRRLQNQANSAIALGSLHLVNKDMAAASEYLSEGLEISLRINNKTAEQKAHYQLYLLKRLSKDYQESLSHHEQYVALEDKALERETQRVIQDITFQYDTEQKQKEITLLRAESAINALKAQNTQYLIGVISIVSILLIGGIWLNGSRKRLKLKTEMAEERASTQQDQFKEIINAEENERKRIARELHDGIGPLLSTVKLSMTDMEESGQPVKLIDEAISEVRTISHNMMPNALISFGLEAAIKDLLHHLDKSGKFDIRYDSQCQLSFDESTAIAVYRVIQEALNNILKYAKADTITLRTKKISTGIFISISDDGVGFDVDSKSDGIGLSNIRSRISMIGGLLEIESKLNSGTTLTIIIPNAT